MSPYAFGVGTGSLSSFISLLSSSELSIHNFQCLFRHNTLSYTAAQLKNALGVKTLVHPLCDMLQLVKK